MKEEIILYDSPDIVEYKSVEGWVTKDGFFFGKDEDRARYNACTHKMCKECNKPYKKYYISCPCCRTKKAIDNYYKLELVEWDNETPLCLYDDDKYFYDIDEVYDYIDSLEDEEITISSLRLVVCKPEYMSEVCESYWEEFLPEDYDVQNLSKEVYKKLQELNKTINKVKPTVWFPSNKRVQLYES